MRLTTKGRFAVTAMIDLALREHSGPVALAGEVLSEKDLSKRIKLLERQMLEHAKNLEFEKAARTRDQLAALREQAFGASVADNVVALPPAAPGAPLKRN